MILISIVTVTYNSSPFLQKYIRSIEKQGRQDIEVILVDCGSIDDTREKIQKLLKNKSVKITFIDHKKNIGFAGGNNRGVEVASGKYLFFLNPDTMLDPMCIKNVSVALKSSKLADCIILPRQKTYTEKKFLQDGVCVDIFGYPYRIFNSENIAKTKGVFFCDGAALIIPKKTFVHLGKFDEGMFMINEDVDLSWKAHLLGIPFIPVPKAVVYHFSGGSMTGGMIKNKTYETTYFRRYLGERNAIRNILKNYQLSTLLWLLPVYVAINIGEMIVFATLFQFMASYQYLKAWGWNLVNLNSTLRKRTFIQRKRTVPDIEVLQRMYFGSGKLQGFLYIKVPKFS